MEIGDNNIAAITIGLFESVLGYDFYCGIKMVCAVKYSYKIGDMAQFKFSFSSILLFHYTVHEKETIQCC